MEVIVWIFTAIGWAFFGLSMWLIARVLWFLDSYTDELYRQVYWSHIALSNPKEVLTNQFCRVSNRAFLCLWISMAMPIFPMVVCIPCGLSAFCGFIAHLWRTRKKKINWDAIAFNLCELDIEREND